MYIQLTRTYLFDCYIFRLESDTVITVIESTDDFKNTGEFFFGDSEYAGLRGGPLYNQHNDIGLPNSAFLKAFRKELVCRTRYLGCRWYGCWFSQLDFDGVLQEIVMHVVTTARYSPGW